MRNLDTAAEADAEVLILVTATDETFSQTVHSRTSYKAAETDWDSDFTSIFHHATDGTVSIDIDRLDEVRPIEG